jgi:hypothetical protein
MKTSSCWARKTASPHHLVRFGERELVRCLGWLFRAGAAREDFGGNVGQVVAVGNKPLPASKEGQHTVCSLVVDEKAVVSTRWSGNREGAWSEVIGREGGDGLVCKGILAISGFSPS